MDLSRENTCIIIVNRNVLNNTMYKLQLSKQFPIEVSSPFFRVASLNDLDESAYSDQFPLDVKDAFEIHRTQQLFKYLMFTFYFAITALTLVKVDSKRVPGTIENLVILGRASGSSSTRIKFLSMSSSVFSVIFSSNKSASLTR